MVTDTRSNDELAFLDSPLIKMLVAMGLALVVCLLVMPGLHRSGSVAEAANARHSVQRVSTTRLDASESLTFPISSTQTYTTYLPLIYAAEPLHIPPGVYPFTDRCAQIPIYKYGELIARVDMCVTSVEIKANGYMQFNMSWTAYFLASDVTYVVKYSDVGNPNMNVTDNVGNRYDHVDLGGAAAETTYFYYNGETHNGWFLFPPAKLGAKSFTFHDDDQHVSIEGIDLVQ